MKIVSSTLKRTAAPALAAGLLLPVFATTPASALTPPGSTAIRFDGFVTLSARSGVANAVTGSVSGGGHLILADQTGVAAGPGCQAVSGSGGAAVDCGAVDTASRLVVTLGDGDDNAQLNVPVNTVVDAGTGADSVATGSGDDTIIVHDGVSGNDKVTCGGGSDTVVADHGDAVGTDCEVSTG